MLLAPMMRFGTEAAKRGFDDRYFESHHPMMGLMGNNPGAFWLFGILWVVTWVLLIVVLIALARWLWKKGDKRR